jgi:hypothetical protein
MKAREITQKMKTVFHIHYEVFMWNENRRGVHDHHSLFRQ